MAWAIPHHPRAEVDAAGNVLVQDDVLAGTVSELTAQEQLEREIQEWEDYNDALAIINNWRSSHSYPLNAFSVVLKTRAREVYSKALVSQRIKRLPAIDFKLRDFRRRGKPLPLSEMQDIGGCRAVVSTVGHVRKLVGIYESSARSAQKLDYKNDYISTPKRTGYRSVHLIYRYQGRKKIYRGMRIEIQIRSNLQHVWATAVETAGTFQRQALKSNRGDKRWRQFFALMGTEIAAREGTPPVPYTPTAAALKGELRKLAAELQVESRLTAYGQAMRETERLAPGSRYYLLELTPGDGGVSSMLTITGFKAAQHELANKRYQEAERAATGGKDVVLVSVESLEALKRAYPSYFLDTGQFVDAVREATS